MVILEAVVCGGLVLECKPCNSRHVSFVNAQLGTSKYHLLFTLLVLHKLILKTRIRLAHFSPYNT